MQVGLVRLVEIDEFITLDVIRASTILTL